MVCVKRAVEALRSPGSSLYLMSRHALSVSVRVKAELHPAPPDKPSSHIEPLNVSGTRGRAELKHTLNSLVCDCDRRVRNPVEIDLLSVSVVGVEVRKEQGSGR
jgi:hypothetical protein